MQLKHFIFALLTIAFLPLCAQEEGEQDKDLWKESRFTGLEFRSIGPAFMSGRIADIAIHPEDNHSWYVAVGSGGIWKTENNGTTWTPLFDDQPVYSTGCVTIDPNNPNTIWVGTGENVGGRHIGYGNGIYRSTDEGKSWKHMGLRYSEHISRIIVHPENPDIIWVAAQGPLWDKGGERGIYKTTDGGEHWDQVLGDDDWQGATDLLIDPRNPDRLYAATWSRHRTVAAYMGGGPGTGIHRSEDGGESWTELKKGLPTDKNMGKIGLAMSPQKPDHLYAAIELHNREGGVYKSTDRGESWTKQSDAVAGATGPHYYQELYASPHEYDKLYLVDVRMQVSEDGGKNFHRMNEKNKHVDNHAMAFRPDDPDYLLVGTDGGLYQSFDGTNTWKFIDNLPVTQFYKLALDDAKPFYNIYGGTQDNNTQGGPSRTATTTGIENGDWKVVLNWDGHEPACEPGNPNIMYAQRQQGHLARVDLKTGEVIEIRPQPEEDAERERYNWDAPIRISPHDPKRLYFASQHLWRSDKRGDSWTKVSPDLTRDQERMELPIMGRQRSFDNPWDYLAMSEYNTITSIAESPLEEGLLYVGTDDGLIQISEDGGDNWRDVDVSALPGNPEMAYVNNIEAGLHDTNTVFVALDRHKLGDFTPYIYKSTDRGRSWTSLRSNLPDSTLVWRIAQDHEDEDLLFLATEFGIEFSVDGGEQWTKLKGGVPTIAFRDLEIHDREDDLVGASFGRGFYIMDDIKPFREISKEQLEQEATLFPLRDARWYFPKPELSFGSGKASQGDSYFIAPNPPFGAVFTYYLKEGMKTKREVRQKEEKKYIEEGEDVPFPGWDELDEETWEADPAIVFTIRDEAGTVIRRLRGPAKEGFNRINWDLRYPEFDPISRGEIKSDRERSGLMAAPGKYTVAMHRIKDGEVTPLGEPQTFDVKPLWEGTLEGAPTEEVAAFWREYEEVAQSVRVLNMSLKNNLKRVKGLRKALHRSHEPVGDMDESLDSLRKELLSIDRALHGSPSKRKPGEKTQPTINSRISAIGRSITHSTYGPTETNLDNMEIIQDQMEELKGRLEAVEQRMDGFELPPVEVDRIDE